MVATRAVVFEDGVWHIWLQLSRTFRQYGSRRGMWREDEVWEVTQLSLYNGTFRREEHVCSLQCSNAG